MANYPEHHLSRDGSSTLFSSTANQFYHNLGGAITESEYVYFKMSGAYNSIKEHRPIRIFEVGFGTGLNFLLALHYYLLSGSKAPLDFYSVEAFPLSKQTADTLNYAEVLENSALAPCLSFIFNDLKPGLNTIQPFTHIPVKLHLFVGLFDDLEPEPRNVDFIFHDPFSPNVNGELWTPETFEKLGSFSSNKAILTTYCSASKARGAMAVAGWNIARAPGTAGKREITIASKDAQTIVNYKRVNEKKLAERYLNGAFD